MKTLRRDRSTFVLVAALLLLFNAFQPLAFAGMAQSGDWSICRGISIEADTSGDNEPSRSECAVCAAGLCSVSGSGAKALLPSVASVAAPAAVGSAKRFHAGVSGLHSLPLRRAAARAPPFGFSS